MVITMCSFSAGSLAAPRAVHPATHLIPRYLQAECALPVDDVYGLVGGVEDQGTVAVERCKLAAAVAAATADAGALAILLLGRRQAGGGGGALYLLLCCPLRLR